jgi:HPt (histidine-containing phosphotransfer) domain-containing protein
LSEGDTGAAERAAHSLKGVAATLGAKALSAAAAEAEVLVRTGQDPEPALEALSLALEPVINGIEAALPREAGDDAIASPSGDPSTVVAPLARLKQLLETDDGVDRGAGDEIHRDLEAREGWPRACVKRLVQRFGGIGKQGLLAFDDFADQPVQSAFHIIDRRLHARLLDHLDLDFFVAASLQRDEEKRCPLFNSPARFSNC